LNIRIAYLLIAAAAWAAAIAMADALFIATSSLVFVAAALLAAISTRQERKSAHPDLDDG